MRDGKERTHGRDLTAAEMAQTLDEFVNSGSMGKEKTKEFVEQIVNRTHRTLQQLIMGLFVATIEGWAEACDQNNFDGRNESTVKLAKKIITATGDKYDRGLPYV
jgi:hypothetical protein